MLTQETGERADTPSRPQSLRGLVADAAVAREKLRRRFSFVEILRRRW
jgi:hypothetical protein